MSGLRREKNLLVSHLPLVNSLLHRVLIVLTLLHSHLGTHGHQGRLPGLVTSEVITELRRGPTLEV